jgi:alcohol dehydrogenase, propanol-preferring
MTEIPTTARAAVVHTEGADFVIEENYPVVQPKDLTPGQCLIEVEYSGLCHSDLSVKNGMKSGWPATKYPIVCGHEGVGKIVAIGENTANSPVKVGDRVGCKWNAFSCLQ